jgi:uncharacterized protein (DUF305 family)
MMGVSFIAMYILMYAMVDRLDNVFNSFNQIYMAGLMTAAMLVIELALMGGMYRNKKLNAALWVVGLLALVGFWILTRQQTAIDDRQFLRSMIPHHAGAILMCEQASVRDPQIVQLCEEIKASQRAEIAQMKSLLKQ